MAQIAEAWEILSNPSKRAPYDKLLASQHEGLRNRKFRDDLRESRIKAYKHARSWAEFEKIYCKAYDTFKRDLEQTDRIAIVINPFSLRSAGESVIVWIFYCMTGEFFILSPPLTRASTREPKGIVKFLIIFGSSQ